MSKEDDDPVLLIKPESDLEIKVRAAVQQDISFILSDFLSQRHQTLNVMLECWIRLDFELIHACRPDDIMYDWFMNCMYDVCLETGIEGVDVDLKRTVASVYLMYALYESQPGNKRIWVSNRVWMHLVALNNSSEKNPELQECAQVLGALVRKDAFDFVAMTQWEIAEAGRRYLERVQARSGPSSVINERLEADLVDLVNGVSSAQSSLIDNAFDLRQAEKEYLDVAAQQGSGVKADLTKDLAQSQHDWSATFDPLPNASSSSSSKNVPQQRRVVTPALGKSAGKNRRATVLEPLERPQTAPPPTRDTPPEYLLSPEHMPSFF